MTIKYNNKVIAGKYREQVIPFANTIDAGIAKIATQEQINEGTDNTSIVTPVYLAQKQDKLTAGEGIDIDATNTISSKVLPDKVTIVENDNKTLSTVARKTINEKLVFDWEGTEAEYHQAIMNGEIDPDWYCYITDDELSVSYNDVLSRTLVNIAPDGVKVLGASNAYLTNDVYIDEAGYNQLLELKNSATQVDNKDNITVNGVLVEIPYVLTHTGSKITDAKYRDILVDFYNENGYTNYFTIDEENKNYTLPMGEIYGKLVDKDLSDISEIAKDIIKDIAGVSFSLFDTKIADHELSLEESLGWALQGTYVYKEAITGERFGYPTFYERCIEEKNAGTAKSVTLGSNTITMYINDNGHQFYNIADKSIVDTYYTSFGIADFYGIDEENECIFLPRNKWFMQLTDDTANVNKFTDAGLPSHTHTFTRPRGDQNYGNGSGNSWWGATNGVTVTTSTPNNSIYGKSTTVQPKSSSKLLYYCVGNTKADTSWVNVFAQVEEGIKEIYDTKAEVLEEVNTLRETSANEIGTLKQDSINEIDTLRATSVNEISTLNTGSLNQIEALKDKSISEINVLKTNSTNEINTLRLESVNEIDTLKQESVSEIDTLKKDSIDEMEDKRVSSNESITTTKEESIEELLDITTDKIQEVKSWSIGTEEERPEGSAKYWAEVAELSSSNALFDTKISDHILKGSEAYGWELQGTYVYKDAVFGEHLGYQDFYFKCLEEYTNPTNEQIYLNSNINTIGSLVNNNGILSGFSVDNYGIMPKYPTNINSFDIQFKFTTGNSLDTSATIFGQYVTNMSTPQFGTTGNGEVYFIASADGTAWSAGISTKVNPSQVYILNVNWDGLKISGTLTDELGNTTKMGLYDVYSDELTSLNWTNLVKIGCDATTNPFNGLIDLNECYININGERWWNGVNYITKNLNGHKYYNIKNKNIIDNLYNQYGIADFYGIDETNERVFLPRNKYFHQLTGDMSKVNEMVEAGLPNITGDFTSKYTISLDDGSDSTGALETPYNKTEGNYGGSTASSTWGYGLKLDASKSNSIYGNSDTVQPQSSLKLLYYCVGNTKADTSWIKLVEQVENGIKDIEDKRVESIKDVDTLRENSIDEILSTKQNYLDELEDKRVSSNNSIEETKDNSIQELVNTSEDLIEETRIWAIGTEEEKPEGSAKYWAKVAELSSSNAIFDTKVSDHILDEAEAHGWTLCGTKAYKEAVIGEHLGYPTFYETCLNEYEQSEIIDRLYSCNVTITGTLTNNDGVVNGFSASNYMTLSNIVPSVDNWEFNLKIKLSDISTTQYFVNIGKSGAYNALFGLVNGKFTLWLSSNNTSWDIASSVSGNLAVVAEDTYYVKYGFNGQEYYLEYSTNGELESYTRDITISSISKIYQPTTTPNIGYGWTSNPANNTFIDLNESFININGERWWTGTTRFNTYRYKNGHEYYLEQDKQYIDQIINIYTHNMYGINLEEQSIIIPHINRTLIESKQPSGADSSWYNLYSDGWCEQGGLYNYGSLVKDWNVVNTKFLKNFLNTNYSLNVQAGRNDSGTGGINNQAFVTAYTTDNFKTEVYGDGNSQYLWWQASGYTNLPDTKLTYTYMCTGNTKADTSWVNVVEQVAEGAKEIYDTKEGVLQEIDILRQGSVDEVDTLRQNSLQEMEDKRVASNESIINTKEDSIEELVETSHDLINESRKWAVGTDEENIEGSAKYWAGVAELSSSNALFDTKVSDHILKDSEAYGWALQGTYVYKDAVLNEHLGYPTFYDKCIEEKSAGTATSVTLGSNTLTIYKHANGHQYYDIADKSKIDAWYTTYGIADYYGIDTTNKRIFLPRNKYFHQLTGDTSKVNEMIEAGLPNIEGYFDITRAAPQNGTGAFSTVVTGGWGEGDNVTTGGGNVTLNASKSNSIYGNSDTVQPQSSLKLLYYCVGNTKADTSWMKLTEQVQEGIKEIYEEKVKSLEEVDTLRINSINEIDTLRQNSVDEINNLREASINEIDTLTQESVQEVTDTKNDSVKEVDDTTLKGLHSLAGASNALTHNQITNCLLEVPQRIKYTLENETLTIKAGSVIIVPYGIEDKTIEFPIGSIFLNENYKVYDTQFSDNKFFVWVELQDDTIASCGNPNSRMIFLSYDGTVIDSNTSGVYSIEPAEPKTSMRWYDTDDNLMKQHDGTNWTTGVYLSLGFMLCTANDDKIFTSVDQVFNGLGYIGSTVWVDKDVKCLVPDGRGLDGTFNNIVYQTNEFKTFTRQKTKNDIWIMLGPNGFVTSDTFEYNEDLNRIQNIGTDNYVSYACIGLVDMNKGLISNFKPKNTFHTIDYNDLKEVHCIIETYKSGASWYRIWSDGWIEQGGNFGTAFSSWTAKTITFLKPFSDVYYYVSPITGHTSNTDSPCINAKTVNTFSCTVYNSTGNACWYACGY